MTITQHLFPVQSHQCKYNVNDVIRVKQQTAGELEECYRWQYNAVSVMADQ